MATTTKHDAPRSDATGDASLIEHLKNLIALLELRRDIGAALELLDGKDAGQK